MRKRQIINDVHFDDQVKLFVSVFNGEVSAFYQTENIFSKK